MCLLRLTTLGDAPMSAAAGAMSSAVGPLVLNCITGQARAGQAGHFTCIFPVAAATNNITWLTANQNAENEEHYPTFGNFRSSPVPHNDI